jgi:hypothetical protein
VYRARRVKSYELLGQSEESKVSDPDIIRITDEANEMLKTICEITNCGRGGIVDVALRVLTERFLENDDYVLKLIAETVNNRGFLEIVRDKLETV